MAGDEKEFSEDEKALIALLQRHKEMSYEEFVEKAMDLAGFSEEEKREALRR